MSREHTQYEVFLSYARKDDVPIAGQNQGWVRALYDQILADQRRFSTEPLRIFYDTHEIRDLDAWRQRILGALRTSKILLVCLSPNYAASEYCRWEWEEYTRGQVHQRLGQDSVAAIYFVQMPGAGTADSAEWLAAVQGGNFTDMRAHFPEGARALQLGEVQRRMAGLGQHLWGKIARARWADKVPGNLRRQIPHFVGRREELQHLHEQLATSVVGQVTAVHGLVGQGKTELAVAYGHAYADCYPAGLWLLGAESHKELLPLIGELAFAPEFGYQPSEAERSDANLLGRAVLAELGRRAEAMAAEDPARAGTALIILDDVSEPTLLASSEVAKLPGAECLRILATTRLEAEQLRDPAGALACVEVGSLQPEDALCLIRDHQPHRNPVGRQPAFASPDEEDAARGLVRELGGLTLAVEQVAVYLGLHPRIAPSTYLARLPANGVPSAHRLLPHDDGQAEMVHQQKHLSAVLETTLAELDPATRSALGFAARLPPHRVPWPWLRALTMARRPELGQHVPDEPDPWVSLRRGLEGLHLVAPGDLPEIGRMHPLVAAHLAAGVYGADLELAMHLAARSDAIYQSQILDAPWELDALLGALPLLLATTGSQDLQSRLAIEATFLSDKVLAYRNLGAACSLLDAAHGAIQHLAAADPSNADWQRDLSVSHNKVGEMQLRQGDLAAALSSYSRSLAIMEDLAASDPSNTGWQRELAVSHDNVGSVHFRQGDLEGALSSYGKSLAIIERLAESDPSHAAWQRDLAVNHDNVGNIRLGQGDLDGALLSCGKSLVMRERLAASDPSNAEGQRDLWVGYWKMGDISAPTSAAESTEWFRKAYQQLLDMKQRGLLISPTDEQFLQQLSSKLGVD